MRVSMNWLRELVELPEDITVQKVADRLSLQGLEVEGLEDLAAPLAGLVVARVIKKGPHPDADRLSVCEVDVGGRIVPVVCGATNFEAGALVAYAGPGVVLAGGLEIKSAKIRGVASEGMLCSEKELGIGADHGGILLLDDLADVEVGMPLARALRRDDVVLEVGVTPNRPDALSHVGVAREVAAGFSARARFQAPQCAERAGPIDSFAHVTIHDPQGCPRYGCRVIVDVTVGPSPLWLQARLAACGVRSINNIVDITNLVMMERGLPLHAFDLDRIAKDRDRSEVIVRSATAGEKLVTLDDKERELAADDLVIADPSGAIALAGVMGGATTEVSASTRRILLEAAYFDPSRVRKTARRLGLHSEASHRFERGCDPNGIRVSLDRAAALIAELGKGEVARGTLDVYPRKIEPAEVKLRPARVAKLLGLSPKEVDEATCSKILLSVGLEVAGRDGEGMRFRIPTFRPDLTREVDLIEEVLRLIGYDKVPETLPNRSGESGSLFDEGRDHVERQARRALRAAGFFEAVNLAFTSPADDAAYALADAGAPIVIRNPLGEEMSLLRRSLLPGLIQNVVTNDRRGVDDVRLFEVGTVFLGANPEGRAPRKAEEDGPRGGDAWAREVHHIAAVMSGRVGALAFDRPSAPVDFYDAKGVVEEILLALGVSTRLGLGQVQFRAWDDGPAFLHPRSRTAVEVTDEAGTVHRVALLGELHPDLVKRADLRAAPVVFEIDTRVLAALAPRMPRAQALPRFPSVRRDLALVVDDAVPAAAICEAAATDAAVRPILEDVEVFDVYRGDHVAPGKKSIALAFVLRAPDRTLTDAEIAAAADALVARVKDSFGAEIRS